MSGSSTWPEQELLVTWFRERGMSVEHSQLYPLLVALTQLRVKPTSAEEPAPADDEARWWNAYSDCCAQFGDTRRALNHIISAVRREEREARDAESAKWVAEARAVFSDDDDGSANQVIDCIAQLRAAAIRASVREQTSELAPADDEARALLGALCAVLSPWDAAHPQPATELAALERIHIYAAAVRREERDKANALAGSYEERIAAVRREEREACIAIVQHYHRTTNKAELVERLRARDEEPPR